MAVFNPVRALERGLTVLQIVNEKDGCKTQEIADIAGLARPTVFRLLETLEKQGFVTLSKTGGRWYPTVDCNLLSAGNTHKSWVQTIAFPEMIKLGSEILWPLDLVESIGGFMQIRESTHKYSPFSFDVGMIGKRLPVMETAGGHAYLAFSPENEREVVLDILRKSARPEDSMANDAKMLSVIIDRTRESGFGYRTDGFKPHTQSISMPIYQGDRVVSALTVICLKTAISFNDMVRRFAEPLSSTCKKIGEQLDQIAKDGSQSEQSSGERGNG